MKELTVHVLLKADENGSIITTMTELGCAQSKMWALTNTSKGEHSLIFERETGKCVFECWGTADFPDVTEESELGRCEEYGVPLKVLHIITDDRFDKMEV